MPTPQDIIATAVSLLHARHLKALGFRKSAHTWTRTTAQLERTELINVQLSTSNTGSEARITLNLGIHVPAFHEAVGGLPVTGALNASDCAIQSRIGSLHEDRQDQWWTVTSSTEPEALAELLHTEIITHALPWFSRLQTYADIARHLEGEKAHFKAAVAHHLAGQPDQARAAMTQALSSANDMAKPKWLRVARSLGIPVEAAGP